MKNPLIFDAAISANWAMDEVALQALLEIAARETHITPQALEAYQSQQLDRAENATFRDGVAILNVEGPLFRRANLMTQFCGATSYDVLMRDFQTAQDSSSVRGIMWNIHSPGGEAAAVAELAKTIYNARGKKPMAAYVSDQGASAAYWIAAANPSIIIGPTAGLGSIGVRAAITDTSARDQARGVKTFEFVSSQSPYKKVDLNTKEGRDRVQARVDALASVFVEAMATYRGVSVQHVLEHFGKGDVLIGKAAVDAGMADGFGTFESVLASLARGEDPVSFTGFSSAASGLNTMEHAMTPEEKAAAEKAEAEAKLKADAEAKAKAEAEALAKAETDAAAAAAATTAERKRVSDIMALTLPGYEKMRDEAIQSGSSAHDFSAKIIAAEKAKSQQRADDVKVDTEANAKVEPSSGKQAPSGDDAAVNAILGAYKLVAGE